MRRCSKCKKIRQLSEYYKDRTRVSGLDCWCMYCRREYDKSRKHNKARRVKYDSSEKGKARRLKYLKSEKGILKRIKNCKARQKAIKQATLRCLTEIDKNDIKLIYRMASMRGMTVDHIIPLQGKDICGLHVPWNLRIISKLDNSKKGAKWKPLEEF